MTRLNWMLSVLVLWAAVATAEPDVRYRLTQIDADPPGTLPVFVTELNDKGVVVGLSDATSGNRHAFLWRNGIYTDLNAQIDGAVTSEASGVNNRSDVIGQYFDAQGTFRNFLLRRGKFIPVETFPGSGNSSAEDINNRGQIAGLTFDFGLARGYIWDRGEVTVLPPLNLVEGASVFTVGQINDRGVVVGTSQAELFRLRAVIWEDGQIVDLGVLPGFFDSRGNAINNRGQVVGGVEGPGVRAFLWEDGDMTLLPLLATGTFSVAFGINDAGEIVGQTVLASGGPVATLWDDEGVVDLNGLIRRNDPLAPFVRLQTARRINNRGEIFATGVDSRNPNRNGMYLLRPSH